MPTYADRPDVLSKLRCHEAASSAVLAHHEYFDGGDYPVDPAGTEIPIDFRVISVIAAYDRDHEDHPYAGL